MQQMFKNENYTIFGNPESRRYEVTNNITGFVEYFDVAYPKCQIVAVEYNDKIINLNKTLETPNAANVVTLRPDRT